MKKRQQVYISGALANSDEKGFYEKIGKMADALGHDIYVPHFHADSVKNPDVSPKEVYETDMDEVSSSCLIIAYMETPSFEVGTELERASSSGIPIILASKEGTTVSRFILGIPMVKQKVFYKNESWAIKVLAQIIPTVILPAKQKSVK